MRISMPKKQIIEEIVVKYLQQEDLDEEQLQILNSWLQKSEENKSCFFQFKDIFHTYRNRQIFSEEEIENSWQKMHEKLLIAQPEMYQKTETKKTNFGKILYASLRYIAVGLTAIIAGLLIARYTGSNQTNTEPDGFNIIHVLKGSIPNMLVLFDGTSVSINASSTLRYPGYFSQPAREVYLEGEAFFEVAPNVEKMFIVKLRQQNIIVHGTSFNVEAYPDESCNIITLIDGSLTAETWNGKGEKISQNHLTPGQKLLFDYKNETVIIHETDTSHSKSWLDGVYTFRDEPLEFILSRLGNYYDVTFHWENEHLKNIRYTGTFSRDEDINYILQIINHEKQFTFQQNGKNIFIK